MDSLIAFNLRGEWHWLLLKKKLIIFGCAGSSLLHGLFSNCGEWRLLFPEVRSLLTAVASFVVELRLPGVWASVALAHEFSRCKSQAREHRLNSCGTWA